jgi:uncharacterized protein YndB with AHSA1/START domain
MSTPDVPLRMELTYELPASPQQVWDAIATANGITAWFLRTELEEREGGAICLYMGENDKSEGTVTGWEPPGRFAYVEPDWAELTGHEGAAVGPMVTEFLVEAQSGGTSVLRVVTSAFGSGADWEQEFFEDMERHWAPYFDNLRLYLSHFPGQQVTPLELSADVSGAGDAVYSALRDALGAQRAGDAVEVRGLNGTVERVGTPPEPEHVLLRVDDPVPGFLQFAVFDKGDGTTTVPMQGYLFSDDASAYVERERDAWKTWLEKLAVPAS